MTGRHGMHNGAVNFSKQGCMGMSLGENSPTFNGSCCRLCEQYTCIIVK